MYGQGVRSIRDLLFVDTDDPTTMTAMPLPGSLLLAKDL